jgi:IclR family pca regulon transcriptional regulator
MMGGLAKGLDVIRAFSAAGPLATLAEIARVAQLSPAAARRCLRTLQALGYVSQEARRFFLRPRVLELSNSYLQSVRSEQLETDHLEQIVKGTGQSSSLAVLDGSDIVYLARVGPKRQLRLEASVGTRYPAFATSLGRVLLSGKSAGELKDFLDRADLAPRTKRTVTDAKRLFELIQRAARDGYSLVEDELAIGIIALAVPISNNSGRVVAAINCSAYTGEVSRAELMRFLPLLQDTATRITDALPHFASLALNS